MLVNVVDVPTLPARSAVALGMPLAALAGPADTVALSLNKGLCAPFGARAAHRWPVQTLKRAFAYMLYALAAYMLWRAWR